MWNTDIHSPCHLFSPLSLKFLTSSSEIRDVSQALFQQRFRYVLSSSMHSSKLAMNGGEPKKATLLYSPSSSSKQLLISLEWSVTSVFQKLVRAQSYQHSGTAPYLWKRVPRLVTVSMGQATTLKYQCYLSFMDCFSPGSQKKGYFWLIQNKSRMNRRVAVVRDNCLIHLLVGYLQNMSAEYRQLHFFILIQPSCLYEEKTNWYKWNRSFSFRLTSIPSFHIAAK